ncbi:MAG: hypothetical protein UU21_C0001G0044 [Candidatus Levybacteria bacterium GW2011_GWA2_40_8]|nr:MAG: hypothetical protein UU21_C0001G0044 [Candidatus Levybacteria bacterium GW2011_GWA2_40_8]
MFVSIVVIIAIVSVILAFWSLKNQSGKKELNITKKELQKGRVVFRSHSSS